MRLIDFTLLTIIRLALGALVTALLLGVEPDLAVLEVRAGQTLFSMGAVPPAGGDAFLRIGKERLFIDLSRFERSDRSLDKGRLRAEVLKIASARNQFPEDASFLFGQDMVVPERTGLEVDLEGTVEALRLAHQQRLSDVPVQAKVRILAPKVTANDLNRFDLEHPIGEFSTRFNRWMVNRCFNIRLAASALDGKVILPGEVFSYNDTVGERTMERGFRLAPVFINKEHSIGVGGGVCQVSTTLYNAAVVSTGLELVERHHHSLDVPYIAPGRDATVVYGYLDLKFKNNKPFPVLIRSYYQPGRIQFRFFKVKGK